MLRLTLRSLWSHKRRLVSTVSAVVLGVAFMCGILVFSDTINRVFDDLFAQSTEDVDTVVQGEVLFADAFGGEQRANVDVALLDLVAGVDGVATAEPYALLASFSAQVLGSDGEPLGSTNGAPTLVESWLENEDLNPYVLTEGSRAPEADGEIAINVAAAEDGDYEVGDTVSVYTQEGTLEYELVGTFLFGTAKSSGGAVSADFTLPEAQRLAGLDGEVTNILAVAEEGVSAEELTGRVSAALEADGSPAEALTGAAFGEQTASSIKEGLSFFTQLLLVFAVIALLVGSFIIYNTFQILVAQRTRELALLRALGAGKGQVLRSVLLEAVVIALVSSVLGVVAGVLLAQGVISAFSRGGANLPTTTLAIEPRTLVVGLVAGTVVTVLAALLPAWRATRVPPLAAMRDVAIDRSGASRLRAGLGVVLLLGAAFLLSTAWTAEDASDALPSVGLGALLAILATIVLGPVIAAPAARGIGFLLPRLFGVTGRLATENAARSPKRTAATASALMIAVALVGFITVLASSATKSIEGEVNRGVSADVIVSSNAGFGPPTGFSTTLADEVSALPDVDAVSAMKFTQGSLEFANGETVDNFVGSIDPTTIDSVLEPRMVEGEASALTDGGLILDQGLAEDQGVGVGDPVTIVVPGGTRIEVAVESISDDLVVLFPATITDATFTANVPEALDVFLWVDAADGADVEAVRSEIEDLASDVPVIQVLDREGFIGSTAQQITGFVTFIYVLLALSVLIALIGIANTLSLSIYERTREIGLLRAVGAVRAQVRTAMRWEAVVIALLGTALGIVLGVVLSWAVITSLGGFGLSDFVVPVGALAFIAVLGALAGVVTSILPARRAARLDVLQAIATD